MPRYSVSWVYEVQVEAEDKGDAERIARLMELSREDMEIGADMVLVIESDPLQIVEVDENGDEL